MQLVVLFVSMRFYVVSYVSFRFKCSAVSLVSNADSLGKTNAIIRVRVAIASANWAILSRTSKVVLLASSYKRTTHSTSLAAHCSCGAISVFKLAE